MASSSSSTEESPSSSVTSSAQVLGPLFPSNTSGEGTSCDDGAVVPHFCLVLATNLRCAMPSACTSGGEKATACALVSTSRAVLAFVRGAVMYHVATEGRWLCLTEEGSSAAFATYSTKRRPNAFQRCWHGRPAALADVGEKQYVIDANALADLQASAPSKSGVSFVETAMAGSVISARTKSKSIRPNSMNVPCTGTFSRRA
mmetsp:Transcript_89870/g.253452  ORF Transcript_89870/g.253452 Transcript_89870/m.253452 type:complete len:202 (-) Transcript_89870:244-849(-)